MDKTELILRPFAPNDLDPVLDLTLRAWAPVFPKMEQAVPDYVFKAFYPDGWQARQLADVRDMCADGETDIHLCLIGDALAGYVGLRAHPEDSMGEIYIIAVDPAFQRRGVGTALMDVSLDWMRERGLAMAMVETGGDAGHAPSRAAYESIGFERYPVARYFRPL